MKIAKLILLGTCLLLGAVQGVGAVQGAQSAAGDTAPTVQLNDRQRVEYLNRLESVEALKSALQRTAKEKRQSRDFRVLEKNP